MATSKVLKPRRGSTAEHDTFKGQAFEITFDTDKKTIVAHDGLTMGGFPLAHEAAVAETDSALRALIDQKVSEVGGVSSSELKALETALRGLINTQAQQQVARDADQDNVVTALDSTLRALIAKAQKSAAVSFVVDGSDLVVTYGDGSTERIPLPAGKSVGDLWVGIDPNSKPAGVQLYAGQLLPRAAYEAHSALVFGGARTVLTEEEWQAQVSANGSCPYYSSGDGSTTYRFPLIKGVHPKFVAALVEAGQYIEAGLPAHNHKLYIYGEDGTAEGTLDNFMTSGSSIVHGYIDVKNYAGEIFGSSIYGRSDTVQPEAITMVVGEWVVGSVATPGEADAESLLASISTLESNVGALQNGVGRTSAYVVETWRSGANWYRKWSDGYIEQGGKTSAQSEYKEALKVTLHLPMTSNTYDVQLTQLTTTDDNGISYNEYGVASRSTSYFKIRQQSSDYISGTLWAVRGY